MTPPKNKAVRVRPPYIEKPTTPMPFQKGETVRYRLSFQIADVSFSQGMWWVKLINGDLRPAHHFEKVPG